MMKLVTVAVFPELFDAYVIKFRLENEGIECFLLDEHVASIRPYLASLTTGGARLQVLEKDVDATERVLKEANCYNGNHPSNYASTQKNITRYFLPLVLIIMIIILFVLEFM